MKNKKEKIGILKCDVIKYANQIGIVNCEIPQLIFDRNEFEIKRKEIEDKLDLRFRESRRSDYLGICAVVGRLIFIKMDRTPTTVWKKDKEVVIGHYHNGLEAKTTHYKKVPYGLREVRDTLIHELVHYRFPYMKHGKKFEQRIKDILRGKQFPKKHLTSPQLSSL